MKKNFSPIWRQIQPNSAKMLKKLCLKNDDVAYCLVEKKTGKAKLWRSICLVMKIFRTVSSDVVWPFKNRFCQNSINKIGQIQPKCLRRYAWKIKSLEIKSGKEKLWRSICLVMKKKNSALSDVVWPFKKIICQNRINEISQIQPKCLRKYAWICQIQPKCLRKYAWKIKSLEIKSGKAKLWRSICLVMKKIFSPIWRHLTLQKNYLPKSH